MRRQLFFAIPGDLATPTGGYGYDRRLIEELRKLGWTTRVVALPAAYPFPSPRDEEAAGSALAVVPDDGLVMIDGLAFGAMADIAAREAERLRLVALVHHPLADETGRSADETAAFERSERQALRHARAVICTSRATARRLEDGFGVEPGRITVAPPGTERKPRAPRRGDPPVLLALGALVPRKGHDVLVEALAALADLDWRARFAGPDDRDERWTAHLKGLAERHGLAGRIEFPGAVEDGGRELARADIFVLASRHEGYGMAFAEALAHGLPVVACRAGAVPDLVPEAAGALVPPDDPGALAEALRRLLNDPVRRRDAADAAWRAGQALPAWDETALLVDKVLKGIAS
ncbi:MAG: glycosyltransferase family 4 protein [Rhizobiaceae bacterium]|nr:glycosyltransferase family 4 protein [Rhizobiaceae bacterium]MCV0404814.1 glycosyltransferase family 4 protein [Rhizobiaceae bacterium]